MKTRRTIPQFQKEEQSISYGVWLDIGHFLLWGVKFGVQHWEVKVTYSKEISKNIDSSKRIAITSLNLTFILWLMGVSMDRNLGLQPQNPMTETKYVISRIRVLFFIVFTIILHIIKLVKNRASQFYWGAFKKTVAKIFTKI